MVLAGCIPERKIPGAPLTRQVVEKGCVRWRSRGAQEVLKIDRPLAGGFLSLMAPLGPRVVVSPCRAMILNAAFGGSLKAAYKTSSP